jgi:hypothetical protein
MVIIAEIVFMAFMYLYPATVINNPDGTCGNSFDKTYQTGASLGTMIVLILSNPFFINQIWTTYKKSCNTSLASFVFTSISIPPVIMISAIFYNIVIHTSNVALFVRIFTFLDASLIVFCQSLMCLFDNIHVVASIVVRWDSSKK